MPSLLAMSFEGELNPAFDMRCLAPGREQPDGWGIAFYRGGEPAATVLKEAAPPPGSPRSGLIKTWEQVASSIFLLHIRAARWGGRSDANTQPFARTWGRRDWLFAHSGSMQERFESAGSGAIFEPVGSTDTEAIFCELLNRVARAGWRSLREADPDVLRGWLVELDRLGVLTCALTDGTDLVVYVDAHEQQPAWVWELKPPYEDVVFGDDELQVDLTRRGAMARKGVMVSTHILPPEGDFVTEWRPLQPGTLLIVRQGAIMAEIAAPSGAQASGGDRAAAPEPPLTIGVGAPDPGVRRVVMRPPFRPRSAPPRRLEVFHRTSYTYDQVIERSAHHFRLEPIQDRLQRVASYQLDISAKGQARDYTDVFGNRVRQVAIETPYDELVIEARSMVVTLDVDPLDFKPLHARTLIPLNWMPWQRHMLQPYLLPPELPESQLIELFDYAMTFVTRNGFDLVDSLLDINQSIFRDYTYKQGATTIATTPFEVYTQRVGVCQDFTNLFICLARLLGIPARYVCGYLYTGPKHTNKVMGEATHAWAQVYLPESGWKGFDPTNGVLTQTDHVRVSVGRSYIDATPTSGTIFVGGGTETLEVSVTVEEVG